MPRATRWPACWDCRRKKFACSITKVGHLRPQLLRRRGAGRRDAFADWRASRCACSSCAGTSTAGTTTVPRTSAKFAPPPTPTARSSRIEYHGWQHNWSAVETSEQLALGKPAAEWRLGAAQQVNPCDCGGMYDIPNVRLVNHQVPGLGYLKGAWLRSPLDLSFSFASEQAIDELACLLRHGPVRVSQAQHHERALAGGAGRGREGGELDAATAGFEIVARRRSSRGRGIGLGTHLASYGAAVAEIEVNKETGQGRREASVRRDRRGTRRESRRSSKTRSAASWCRPPAACSTRK